MTLQVHLSLDDTRPAVWRRMEVASDLPLVMGWTDSHLHQFVHGDPLEQSSERFLTPGDLEEGERGTPEAEVHVDEVLHEAGDTLAYVYDFGDGWVHTLRLEAVLPRPDDAPRVRCTAGERACPPEDCGGVSGYAAIVDGTDEDGARFGPRALPDALTRFDVDDVNHLLVVTEPVPPGRATSSARANPLGEMVGRARGSGALVLLDLVGRAELDAPILIDVAVAARMVEPFVWLVRHIGPAGLPLTGARYLRPVDVRAVAAALGIADEWIGALNRESQTYPVLALRQAAQQLGLLRVAGGRVAATRAATRLVDDPVGLWWHIAGRLPLGSKPHVRDAAIITLLSMAAAEDDPAPGVQVMEALGWIRPDGVPLTAEDVDWQASRTREVLVRLGALARPGRPDVPARRTAAGGLFARAALQRWG